MAALETPARSPRGTARTDQRQREEQRLLTERKLLKAAVVVFARDGYVGARIEDVAIEAGVSRATFYRHFRSKADIVARVLRDLQGGAMELYSGIDRIDDPTRADVLEWIRRIVDNWGLLKDEIQVMTEAVTVEPDLTADYVAAINRLAGPLASYLDRRAPSAGGATSGMRATLFLFQLERFCYFWKVRGEPFDDDEALGALAESLWSVMYPGELRSDLP